MLFDHFNIVDLTHYLSPDIPTWDGSRAFQLKGDDVITTYTSSGTHIDAPSMQAFFGGQPKGSIAELPPKTLMVPACVIDVSSKAHPNYQISSQDIVKYETAFGTIAENSLVIGYTGWSRHWEDAKAYRNVDAKGIPRFPTFTLEAIQLLLTRNIVGIGTDAFSPDPFDSDFPVHQLLFKAEKYIIENIANCSLLPPVEAYVIALPIKIDAQEAPARVLGLIPNNLMKDCTLQSFLKS